MITYEEARKIITQYARPLNAVKQPVKDSLGSVLASDIKSPVDLPGFDNSAMDGFVLRSRDTIGASVKTPVALKIGGAIRAGRGRVATLRPGCTFKIMTGAVIPQGADTVLQKENAIIQNGSLAVAQPIRAACHIRRRGEEISRGKIIRLKGSAVTAGVIGFLSGLGLTRVRVYPKPKVSLIATGDEIVFAGKKLAKGQIYDSNTPMLTTALQGLGINPIYSGRIADKKDVLQAALSKAMSASDLVILTGGVSVGDYDHAKDIFKSLGIQTIFWRVRQKPGKPIFFGKKGATLIFGLPGNPAAVHACFYQYVYPAIRIQMGYKNVWMRHEIVGVKHEIKPDPEKTLFLKAIVGKSRKRVYCEVLGHQGSHMLSSLCRSHGFILVPPGNKTLKKGQGVSFQYLPGESLS